MQRVARIFLFIFGIIILLIGVSLLWGSSKFGISFETAWISSFLFGSILIAYTIPMFWTAIVGQLKMLSGLALSLFVNFLGCSIYLLGGQQLLFGTLSLFGALFAIWFFMVGRYAHYVAKLPIPKSLQVLFICLFSLAFLQGIYLMTANFALFPWILDRQIAPLLGWIFLGSSLLFLWNLFYPFWENAYPLLFALIIFDGLMIGPLFGLFREAQEVTVVHSFLWGAICAIIISGLWAIWEVICRYRIIKK